MLRLLKSNLTVNLSKHINFCFSVELPPREQMQYDVVIVGGGVAGLATAIKLKQK